VAACAGLKVLLDASVPFHRPFLLFFAGIMVAGWYGGRGPGLFATAVSAVIAGGMFVPNTWLFAGYAPADWLGLTLFVGEGGLMSYLTGRLRAARTRLGRVVDSNIIGMAFWRDGGEIIDANDALLDMLGRPRADLARGFRWQECAPPEWLWTHEAALADIRRAGVCAPYESVALTGDGRHVPIMCAGARVPGPRADEGVSWVIDITDRKRMEGQHRESLEIIETVNRMGQRLAAELDLGTLLQTVTDAVTQLTHAKFGAFFYNVTDEAGESYKLYTISGVPREAFSKFPMPRNTALFGPTFRGAGPIRSGDIVQDPRYGQSPPHHGMPAGHLPVRSYLAVPVVSRSGEVFGGLFLGHPEPDRFTERDERVVVGLAAQTAVAIDNARLYESERNARTAAEAASRTKDEFLSVLSHELRTPLASMLSWLRVLRGKKALPAERVEQALASMERSARLQAKLVEDLLDVSRIVTGRLRLDLRPVGLAGIARAALQTVTPAAEAKGVRLLADLDGADPVVAGDADRLQQVVWNLLSNAVKFTPGGGEVRVWIEVAARHARLVVRDTGRGIPREFLPSVFERFQQADTPSTRAEGGLGLGLAIVRHLVELHGGTVGVESPGEGAGATFMVTLPVLTGRMALDVDAAS
jgi:PAS domain S-box-containing protein